jgi:hypothetical protein
MEQQNADDSNTLSVSGFLENIFDDDDSSDESVTFEGPVVQESVRPSTKA